MGRARIISGGDDGLYTIERLYNRDFYEQQKGELGFRVEEADALIEQLQARLDQVDEQVKQADQALKEAQELYIEAVRSRNEDPEGEWVDPSTGEAVDDPAAFYMDQLGEVMRDVADIYVSRAALKNDIEIQRAARNEAQKKIDSMDAMESPPQEQAWCADFTEDASGEVATIEIPGEPQSILIAPLSPSGAGEPIGGQLIPREWMSGPQAFFNAAILPGWQKWMPTYRVGEILSLDPGAGTCSVQIDPATSTARGLGVNQQGGTLHEVPVRYMECDSSAFEDGDRVVVRFDSRDWDQPVVVGFESNPKVCEWPVRGVYNTDSQDHVWIIWSGKYDVLAAMQEKGSALDVRVNGARLDFWQHFDDLISEFRGGESGWPRLQVRHPSIDSRNPIIAEPLLSGGGVDDGHYEIVIENPLEPNRPFRSRFYFELGTWVADGPAYIDPPHLGVYDYFGNQPSLPMLPYASYGDEDEE